MRRPSANRRHLTRQVVVVSPSTQRVMRLSVLALALAPMAFVPPTVTGQARPSITTADQLVRAMHDRYAATWYHTLSFQQDAIRTMPDGSTQTQVWLEAADVPGKLWIETGPHDSGNGAIYRNDSLYVIRGGQVARSLKQRNALLILGFDVYRQPAAVTSRILAEEGFVMGPVRSDSWQGRSVWVAGAAAGDAHHKQFWVDKQRLLFVRMIAPDAQDSTKTSDIRFNKYRKHGGGWVSPEVDFLVDGKRTLLEVYANVKVDVALDKSRFDPASWKTK